MAGCDSVRQWFFGQPANFGARIIANEETRHGPLPFRQRTPEIPPKNFVLRRDRRSLFFTAPTWRQAALNAAQNRQEPQAEKAAAVHFDPSFKTAPPEVQSITIEAIDRTRKTNNARLTIVFKKNFRLQQTLPIQVGEKTVVLKRVPGKSPRTFTGIVAFDFDAFAAEQKRRADLAKRDVKVKVFDRRRLVGEAPIEFVSPDVTKSGLLTVSAGDVGRHPCGC